jgi:hypothetical protein
MVPSSGSWRTAPTELRSSSCTSTSAPDDRHASPEQRSDVARRADVARVGDEQTGPVTAARIDRYCPVEGNQSGNSEVDE